MLSVEIIAGLVSKRHFFRHPLFFVIGILLIIWGVESSSIDFWSQQMIFGVAAFLMITNLALFEMNGGWKSNRIFRAGEFVGNYSYSLYLIHTPFVVLLTKIGRAAGTRDSVFIFVAALLLILLFIQIPAYLLYYLVERHGQSKRTFTTESQV